MGLAAASLGGVPTANGTCIGISGINIGDGCNSSFGNFALGLGEGTVADASSGFLNGAIATGTNTQALSNGFGSLGLAGGSGSRDPRTASSTWPWRGSASPARSGWART